MLGVHFAITADHERLLLATDAGIGEILEDIEESWDDDVLSVSTDKAWDEMHRCLSDGTLDPDGGEYPLSYAVLGGRHLHEEYYVVYLNAAEVCDVAEGLSRVDEAWLRQRFDAIEDADHGGDFGYVWENFVDVRAFYERAAKAGRAVIFTAT
ncbi:YfbM family protein [Actinomadura sp. 6N118]|uniref:YfbM family protein n=1 Tax=Actinomadura sp. 6N118 TaxID=3375151 RepID=UPI0037A93606